MESILLGITVFTGVILVLVLILNFAESKLLPQGEMTITVNEDEDKKFKVRPGGTLLAALAKQTIFSHQPAVAVVPVLCANVRF